jgi:hypothetical protein
VRCVQVIPQSLEVVQDVRSLCPDADRNRREIHIRYRVINGGYLLILIASSATVFSSYSCSKSVVMLI